MQGKEIEGMIPVAMLWTWKLFHFRNMEMSSTPLPIGARENSSIDSNASSHICNER
jgi:hypothetical protein